MDRNTYETTKGAIINVPTPQDTRTYRAFSHESLIDLTLDGIYHSGFLLDKEEYTMARDGNVANGRYTIKNVKDNEMQIQVGWQNSLDKSISLKWAMGVHVLICSNGCVSGEMGAFKKKHNGEIQTYTPYAIGEYIKTAGDVFLNMQKEREAMKLIEVTKRTTAELLGRMVVEEEFITTTQLNIIKKELEHPTYKYGEANSLWSLYQYVTYSMKGIHPTLWMQDHIDAHKFFTEAADILNPQVPVLTLPVSQLNLFNDGL